MRKRFAALGLAALLCAAGPARAQEAPALPEAVTALCEAAHPGYAVAEYDGWGDETRGQFAIALSDGEHNALAIAERGEGDAAYALTVDNPGALFDGEAIPDLLIDTGGDALFIGYPGGVPDRGAGFVKIEYACFKGADGWGSVSATGWEPQDERDGTFVSYMASVSDGTLRYTGYLSDENDNTLKTWDYAPIPVSDEFARAMRLESFAIDGFAVSPVGEVPGADGLADGLLDAGDRLIAADAQRDRLVLLAEKPVGVRRLRVAEWDGQDYDVRESDDLPQGTWLDAFHASEGQILLGYMLDGKERRVDFALCGGTWVLTGVTGDEGMSFTADSVYGGAQLGRNDGSVYGRLPWGDLFSVDFSSLPGTMQEAVLQMDTTGYAIVNNPDPGDRLHLRTRASRSSASKGKFFNGTPVQVLSREGEWARVRIGLGETSLEGYMMTEYLAFGEDRAGVKCVFPQVFLREEYKADGLPLRSGADWDAPAIPGERFTGGQGAYLIGVSGEGWYVAMLLDGSVGYVPQSAFEEGNG